MIVYTGGPPRVARGADVNTKQTLGREVGHDYDSQFATIVSYVNMCMYVCTPIVMHTEISF